MAVSKIVGGVMSLTLAILWQLTLAATAEPSVIDFEAPGNCASKIEGGYIRIENSRGTICISSATGNNSVSNGSRFSNDVEGLVVTQLDGQEFTPLSMSVAEYSLTVDPPDPLDVTGYLGDGSRVMMAITLDGVRDGPGGADDFERVEFPDSFAGIVRLEFGSGRWSLDDLVAEAPATPPLSPGPRPHGTFESARKLMDSPSSLSLSSFNLVLLDHYVVQNFDQISAVIDARNDALEIYYANRSEVVDPVTFDFYFGDDQIRRDPVNGATGVVVDLATLRGLGYAVTDLRISAAYDGTLLFVGSNTSGPDHFHLFTYRVSDGVISPLVTPSTELVDPPLPHGEGRSAQFPRFETIGAGGIAFDTSLVGLDSATVVFEQPAGSMDFRRLIGEGDDTGFGGMSRLRRLEYQGSDLVVDVQTGQGTVRLVYRDGNLLSSALVTKSLPIAAEESSFGGDSEDGDPAARIVNLDDGVYQCEGGLLHRVIAPGDFVSGVRVQRARYLATSSVDPGRVLVLVYLASEEMNGYYEVELGEPDPPAVELGEPFFWAEPALIYIPVNYATRGRRYTLYTSRDLVTWTPDREISEFGVRPRFWYPHSEATPRMYFKVEESPGQ